MDIKEKNNNKLNDHKIKTNELIGPINDVIKHLGNIDQMYLKIKNPVEIYRNKIFDIYNSLDKKSIDFWDDHFVLGDVIRYHLEEKMYYNVKDLLELGTKLTSKKGLIIIKRKTNQGKIKEINKKNEYIKDYDIKSNIYETIIWYYQNIDITKFKPKEIVYSYINMKYCLKEIGLGSAISKEQEKNIIKIIEEKENECKNYREKFTQLLSMLKEIANNEETSKDIKKRTKNKN